MSPKYEAIKKYYEEELWSLERVKAAVSKGCLTKAEYKEITGKKYAE